MANLIDKAKLQINSLIQGAYESASNLGILAKGAALEGVVEIPRDTANGDYAANHALKAAKSLRMSPAKIAQAITDNIILDGTYFSSVTVAGPGFINFKLSDKWYTDVIQNICKEKNKYGSSNIGAGKKVMVEFVSANPTGPMTIGNARGGVLGDTLASVLSWAGYIVSREFYVNDAGNQIDLFGKSIEARYLQLCLGEDAVEFPDNGYHGDDIKELAQNIFDLYGDKYLGIESSDRCKAFTEYAIPHNVSLMKQHLERYRIKFDTWFSERSLHDSGYVAETVELLEKSGYTYEKDGALWLKNTEFGADKDEVLRRSNGFYTYYAVDIAYHRNKFLVRNFDEVTDVWGADHHGHAIRFNATMTSPAVGISPNKLHFFICQMVRLTRNGETIKVSKRTGKAMTLNDLLDEISVDACRFFFNTKADTHMEFDIELAKRQDSDNPVYYVQYAHARICSLLNNSGVILDGNEDLTLLLQPEELELIKVLAMFPEEVKQAALNRDPSLINRYVIDVAAKFHKFYNACRIKGETDSLAQARLQLADCTRQVIANALSILGVSAPEKM